MTLDNKNEIIYQINLLIDHCSEICDLTNDTTANTVVSLLKDIQYYLED